MSITVPVDQQDDDEKVEIANVEGSAPPIQVEFVEPTIGDKMFRTGNLGDRIVTRGGSSADCTLISAGNQTAIAAAYDFGLQGHELPTNVAETFAAKWQVDAGRLWGRCADTRNAATDMMKGGKCNHLVLLAPPQDYTTTGGDVVKKDAVDILSRVMVNGDRMHHAHPVTSLVALACAAAAKGTVAQRLLEQCGCEIDHSKLETVGLRVGHPGGVMTVLAKYDKARGEVVSAGFVRTARILMEGDVYVGPLL